MNNEKAKQLSSSQILEVSRSSGGTLPDIGITPEVSRSSGGTLPDIGITPTCSVQEDRHSALSLRQRHGSQHAGGNTK